MKIFEDVKNLIKENQKLINNLDISSLYREASSLDSDEKGQLSYILQESGIDILPLLGYEHSYLFYNSPVRTFTFPKNFTTIPTGTFFNCTNLIDVIFPEDLITIRDAAFYNCAKLRKISLPKTLSYIMDGAFMGCFKLSQIEMYPIESIERDCFTVENLTIKFHGTLEDWNNIYKADMWNSGKITVEASDEKIEI